MFRRWPKSNFDADNGVDSAFYFLTVSSCSMRNPLVTSLAAMRQTRLPRSVQRQPGRLVRETHDREWAIIKRLGHKEQVKEWRQAGKGNDYFRVINFTSVGDTGKDPRFVHADG